MNFGKINNGNIEPKINLKIDKSINNLKQNNIKSFDYNNQAKKQDEDMSPTYKDLKYYEFLQNSSISTSNESENITSLQELEKELNNYIEECKKNNVTRISMDGYKNLVSQYREYCMEFGIEINLDELSEVKKRFEDNIYLYNKQYEIPLDEVVPMMKDFKEEARKSSETYDRLFSFLSNINDPLNKFRISYINGMMDQISRNGSDNCLVYDIVLSTETLTRENYTTLYHESGHALLNYYLEATEFYYGNQNTINKFGELFENRIDDEINFAAFENELKKRYYLSWIKVNVKKIFSKDDLQNEGALWDQQMRKSGLSALSDIYDALRFNQSLENDIPYRQAIYEHPDTYWGETGNGDYYAEFQEIFAEFVCIKCLEDESLDETLKNLLGEELYQYLNNIYIDALNGIRAGDNNE